MSESIVYVIQAPSQSRDFSSALKYGKLIFLLENHEKVSMLPVKAIGLLRRKLRNFSKEDFIVWSGGDPLAPILAGIVLGEYAFKEVNYLRWERNKLDNGLRANTGYYIPGKLILRNINQPTPLYSEDLNS